jgi:hypothetical protein
MKIINTYIVRKNKEYYKLHQVASKTGSSTYFLEMDKILTRIEPHEALYLLDQ